MDDRHTGFWSSDTGLTSTGVGTAGRHEGPSTQLWFFDLESVSDPSTSHLKAVEAGATAVQRRAAARRRLLLKVLVDHAGTSADDLEIYASSTGKPEVAVAGRDRAVRFNCSSSGGRFAVAVSDHGPVGVDIEAVLPHEDLCRVADDQFTAAEARAVHSCDAHATTFYRVWVAREAYVKLTGQGLNALRSAPPHPALRASPLHLSHRRYGGTAPTWLLEGPLPPGCRFALVAGRPLQDVTIIDLTAPRPHQALPVERRHP